MNNLVLGANGVLFGPVEFQNKGEMLMQTQPALAPNVFIGFVKSKPSGWTSSIRLNFFLPTMRLGYAIQQSEGHNFVQNNGEVLYLNEDEIKSYRTLNGSIVPEISFSRRIIAREGKNLHLTFGAQFWLRFNSSFPYELDAKYYTVQNSEDMQLYTLTTEPFNIDFPILPSAFLGLKKDSKRFPNLAYNLRFTYSPFKSFRGSYKLLNLGYVSSGTYAQTYSNLSLGLVYRMPFEDIKDRLSYVRSIDAETGLRYGRLERIIEPGTAFIQFTLGSIWSKVKVKDAAKTIRNISLPSFQMGATYSRTLKNDLSLYSQINYLSHTIGILSKNNYFPLTHSIAKLNALEIGAGAVLKWRRNEYKNWVNFKLGVLHGVYSNPSNINLNRNYQVEMNAVAEEDIWYVQLIEKLKQGNYTTLVMGLEKEVKLAKGFYWVFQCDYQHGFYNSVAADIFYYQKGNQNVNRAELIFKGQNLRISTGFQIKI